MTNNEIIGKINEQLDFINFLTDKNLIEYLSKESMITKHSKGQYNNSLPISIQEKKEIVAYFYGELFGVLDGLNVFAMMHGLRKKYDVKIIEGNGNSGTGINKNKTIIGAKIFTDQSIQGFETMVHEIAHVLTGRNNRHITLLKKIEKTKTQQQRMFAEQEYEGYCREKSMCKYDVIGEIEAMSIEKLFLLFLSEDKKCRKVLEQYQFDIDEYINEYEKEHENMAYERKQKIVEIKQLLDKYKIIDYFKDKKDFEKFLSKLPSDTARENFRYDMENFFEINAKYSFRYVTGEAISRYWFDRYKISNKNQREQLIDKFVEFWHETDKLDIDQSSSLLCDGKTFDEVIIEYFEQTKIRKNKWK